MVFAFDAYKLFVQVESISLITENISSDLSERKGGRERGHSLPWGYANAAVQIFSRKAAPTKPIPNPRAATTLRGRQVLAEGERAHTTCGLAAQFSRVKWLPNMIYMPWLAKKKIWL